MLLKRTCDRVLQRGPNKAGPQTNDHNSVKTFDLKTFFAGRFLGTFAVTWILNVPQHLASALSCETLISAKQALNDKLESSVAAYLRCGGVVNNQIKKNLLLDL